MTEPVAPTRTDPLARSLSEVVGGPVGAHARPHRWWTPVRVLLVLTSVLLGLAIVQHQPCLKTSWTGDQARYGKMCYSDIPYLYTGRGFAEGRWPYAENDGRFATIEYPVGIAYVAWATAQLVQLAPTGPPVAERRAEDPSVLWGLPGMRQETNDYFLLTALVLALCALASTWLLAGVARRRPWDALPFALSPCLLLTGLVNWDLLAVVLVAGALWAWARGRPLLTGVLIGLGTATKLYPLFLLGGVLVLVWRRRSERVTASRSDEEAPTRTDPWAGLGDFWLAVAGATAAWLLADLPALLTDAARWRVFWSFNSSRGADLGSLWLVLSHHGTTVSPHWINVWSWVLFALVCAGVAVLGTRLRRTPTLAQLGVLLVAGFLLVNKVYSPQYVLWLLPLAVIALPRWRDLLVWQAGELVYFAAVWLYLGGWVERGRSDGVAPVYDLAIWVRVAAELYLVARVVWVMVRRGPEASSADDDVVDVGRGEPHPHLDLVAHGGDR